MTVNSLEQKIQHYAQAYYDGEPLISDEEFDNLVTELKKNYPDSELLKTGWGYSTEETESTHLMKFRHSLHVGSLDKIKLEDLIQKSTQGSDIKDIVVTPKLDGGSAVCYYNNGILERIVTRGDGSVGLDVTANLRHKVPQSIPYKDDKYQVRGELLLTWEEFENLEGSHPRNKAVGISQSKTPTQQELSLIRFVAFRFYSLENDTSVGISVYPAIHLDILSEIGFETPKYEAFEFFSTDPKYLNNVSKLAEHLSTSKDGKKYPIDGLVFTNEADSEKSFALKLLDEQKETTVIGHDWELTSTARYVPVVLVEPFVIDGVTISRISANNATWLKEMGLGIGARILACRANGVIPHIDETLDRVEIDLDDLICPACGEPLSWHGRDLVCKNEACPGKEISTVKSMFKYITVDGVGPKVVDKVIALFCINSIEDFFHFLEYSDETTLETLQNELGNSYGAKVYSGIKELWKWEVDIKVLLDMANIPMLGESISTKIVENFTVDEFKDLSNYTATLETVMNHKTAYSNLLKYRSRIDRLLEKLTLVEYKKEFVGLAKMTYAVTGSLSKARKDIIKEFLSYGYEWVDPSKADVLIADAPSSSAKYKTAVKRGIPIMNEQEFRNQYIA